MPGCPAPPWVNHCVRPNNPIMFVPPPVYRRERGEGERLRRLGTEGGMRWRTETKQRKSQGGYIPLDLKYHKLSHLGQLRNN